MIEITEKPISPELVVDKVRSDTSGCVVTYIGLIRNYSQGKRVLSVEYEDSRHKAKDRLQQIAIASAHRQEGFAACQYAIDRFKEILPTKKRETYTDGSIWVEGE